MIIFLSNYYNHHQAPFSEAMYRITGGEYRFIATSTMPEERLKFGYENNTAPFVMQYSENPKECQKYIDEADTVIFGSAPYELIKTRLKKKKLTFVYSERIYKTECPKWQIPLRAVKYFLKYGRYKRVYLLCSSAYTAPDYALTGTFIGKAYKWGYFPMAEKYADIDGVIAAKKKNSLLWVARFIACKHPELPILAAKQLKSEGYSFEINFIGSGDLQEKMQELIDENNVSDCVHWLGSMKPAAVREYMKGSEIFMFTSDRNEGWGAVLNEAMNSGCAVAASQEIGAVPYLIKNGENGLIYDGSLEGLCKSLRRLLDNEEERKAFGREAYLTIDGLWNENVAAEHFLELARILAEADTCDAFSDGPCSLH